MSKKTRIEPGRESGLHLKWWSGWSMCTEGDRGVITFGVGSNVPHVITTLKETHEPRGFPVPVLWEPQEGQRGSDRVLVRTTTVRPPSRRT